MAATTAARKFCPDTGDVKMNEVFLSFGSLLRWAAMATAKLRLASVSHEFELALCVE